MHKICGGSKISAEYIVSGTTPDETNDERFTAMVAVLKTVEPAHLQCCMDMLTLLVKEFSPPPAED